MPDNKQATVTPIDGFRAQSQYDNDDGVVKIELPPKVEPGCYQLAFVQYRTAMLFGRAPKVALQFRILDCGEFNSTQLTRWYNCKRLMGQPKKSGNFHVGAHCDFLREYLNLFPDALTRRDRISFRPYRNNVIKGRIETVTHNARQQLLPEPMQYSIIRELLEAGA